MHGSGSEDSVRERDSAETSGAGQIEFVGNHAARKNIALAAFVVFTYIAD